MNLLQPTAPPVDVLVADDSAVFRKLIELTLSPTAFKPIFAKTGREAIAVLTDSRPSLAIIDWMMPDITGLQLCDHIRSRTEETAYTYIILLTARIEKSAVIEGLSAGADDYLTKPFDGGELLARLGVGLRMVELHGEIASKNRLLEQLALTDSLTGLPNRRAIEEWGNRQLNAAARYKFPFWILIADLDHFKSVNDTFGHAAGDVVIQSFAKILKDNSRKSDICGRLGGEEFVLALTHTDARDVLVVTDRIRTELARCIFNFDGRNLTVTTTFGIAGFEANHEPSLNSLLLRADNALYSAKKSGRNRVEFSI